MALSESLSNVLFTPTERRHKNRCMFSSSRLQYASTTTKRAIVSDMVDRGLMTVNEAREIIQLAPIEGGDVRLVRGEFYQVDARGHVVIASGGISEEPAIEPDSIEEPTEEEADDAVSAAD